MSEERTHAAAGDEARLSPVSVVIISKNNRRLLEQAVVSVGRVDYPRSKLQVVVLEETDDPRQPASWVDYHTIPVRNLGFGFARNAALRFARHPLVIFTDDDCTVAPDWIRELTGPLLESPDIAAVGGAVLVPACGAVGQCENILGFPGGGMRYVHTASGQTVRRSTFSTCNCAVRRSAIDAAGGFDESMIYGGEDERISRAIGRGGTIVYRPGAVVYHRPRDSLRSVFGWFVRRGYAQAYRTVTECKRSRRPAAFMRNALAPRAAALAALSAVSGWGMRLFLPVLLLYYCRLLWKYRWARRYYPSPATTLMVPLVRTVMDAGRDWGTLKGLLAARRRAVPPEAR